MDFDVGGLAADSIGFQRNRSSSPAPILQSPVLVRMHGRFEDLPEDFLGFDVGGLAPASIGFQRIPTEPDTFSCTPVANSRWDARRLGDLLKDFHGSAYRVSACGFHWIKLNSKGVGLPLLRSPCNFNGWHMNLLRKCPVGKPTPLDSVGAQWNPQPCPISKSM